jgi:hypothetical protein
VFVFAAYMIGHFVVLNVPELGLRRTLNAMVNQKALAHSLMHAVPVWFVYIALEPLCAASGSGLPRPGVFLKGCAPQFPDRWA